MEIEQDAVAQHGNVERPDVFVGDVIAAFHEGFGLGGQYQELGGADAGAIVHILLDEVGGVFVATAGDAHQLDGVAGDTLADRHHADELLEIDDLLGGGGGRSEEGRVASERSASPR